MLNSKDTFIQIAPDSTATTGLIPKERGGKKTVASIQYELLSEKPYHFNEEEVLFETHVRHRELPAREVKANRKELWEQLFSKPQACLRASPLPKSHGWGIHFDLQGKIALHAVDSPEYGKFVQGGEGAPALVFAMRSKRA